MCLDNLGKFPLNVRFGYKVFHRSIDKKLGFVLRGNNKHVYLNRWLNEKDYRDKQFKKNEYLISDAGSRYRFGFHIFLTDADAFLYRASSCSEIRRVTFRQMLAKGYEFGRRTVVVKEMKVLERVS